MSTTERPVAIVTGAASGIGRALSLALARQGVSVVAIDVNEGGADALADEIRAGGGWAQAFACDVTCEHALADVTAAVLRETGRIDRLFNVAGLEINGDVLQVDMPKWRAGLAVDLDGVIQATRVVYPYLRDQRCGEIVTVASLAGLVPLPGLAYYSAAKHAVVAFMLALRTEALAYGVSVSLACPALVDTEIRANTAAYLQRPQKPQTRLRWPRTISAEFCADEILRAAARRQAVVVIPGTLTWVWWLYRISPGLFLALTGRLRARWMTDPAL